MKFLKDLFGITKKENKRKEAAVAAKMEDASASFLYVTGIVFVVTMLYVIATFSPVV